MDKYKEESVYVDDRGLKDVHIHYVIGDTLLQNSGRSYNIYKKNVFKDTILGKYSYELRNLDQNDRNRLRRFDILKKIIIEMTENKKYEKPKNDEIVIHLRLGDVMINENLKRRYCSINIKQILNVCQKTKRKNIVIVTASHTMGLNEKQIEEANKRSTEFLNNTVSVLEKYNLNVSIRSNRDIDSDFIYLCYAKKLITSGCSGFAQVASILNKMIN